MLRFLALALLSAPPAAAYENEWQFSAIGALELPGLQSQSPTDFDLATWATGAQVNYGLTNWLHLGGRVIYSQVDAVIEDYTASNDLMDFTGRLFVDLSAWRTEALLRIRLINGLGVEPHLTLAGGYTWTIYQSPVLEFDDDSIDVNTNEDFADGSFNVTGTLDVTWRVLPFLEVGIGAELSRYFDGLYQTAVRFPISVTGVFWGLL